MLIRFLRLIQSEVQIAELAGYISLSRPEPERQPYVQSIRQKLVVEEGQTPRSEDVARRREVFSVVFGDVKGLGEGTDRGACQCCFSLHASVTLPSRNRDRRIFQPFIRTSIKPMAD